MNFFDIFRNKRSVTYREEFQITSKNWNSNRRLVVVFIGILALAQVGLFIKELQIVTLFALVLIVIFGLQEFRLYCTQKIPKFQQCTLILDLYVQKKIGLGAVWM